MQLGKNLGRVAEFLLVKDRANHARLTKRVDTGPFVEKMQAFDGFRLTWVKLLHSPAN